MSAVVDTTEKVVKTANYQNDSQIEKIAPISYFCEIGVFHL